jgi:hypothetical protein
LLEVIWERCATVIHVELDGQGQVLNSHKISKKNIYQTN